MNLIVIPFHDWKKGEQQGFRDRENHLMELMVDDDRFEKILVVDRPVSPPEMCAKGKSWKTSQGETVLKGFGWQVVRVRNGFYVLDFINYSILNPLLLRRNWWFRAYENKRFHKTVLRIATSLGFDRGTIMLNHPFGVSLVDALPHERLIFEAQDNFLKIDHFSGCISSMEAAYSWISSNADGITGVSREALDNLFEGRGTVMPNGVNIEFFQHPRIEHGVAGLRNHDGPTAGYVGTLAKRIDVELLEYMADELPHVRFFLAGPVVGGIDFIRLKTRNNVFFTGNLPYEVVPAFLRDLSVCIMPHRVNKYENDGDAIKLYEYIASGKPVIATPILGTDKFADVIHIENDGPEFVRAFKELEKRGFKAGYSENVLENHGWIDKLDTLYHVLEGKIDA